ncbi:lipopolysaccharide heptosyltransferase I [Halarcobacter sp.]|uniref:lipopolysaccharide heptosyltransferase I n=1 Tax=Halarcobacter sp. TaxID=2321133 RepID=UPI0029F49A80|nr:lipopolysaccharide heptosyltransferase I [Halarcobacter sp.]
MKIAIVKLSAMGDIVHAMVALQFIKKHNPNIEIDWFVEKAFFQVLENNPDIDNIYSLNLKAIKKDKKQLLSQIKQVKRYSKKTYDLVIDAQGLIKSAIVAKLLGKKVAGFSKNSIREKAASYFYKKKVSIAYDENTIDRNAKVLSKPLGFEILEADILDMKPFLYYKDEDKIIYEYLKENEKNIIFVIGSTWESRNYPKEKFLNIANSLKNNCLIVWGNEEEKEKALWLEENSKYIKAMPKINLNSLKALISKCDLLIGNDTGPTHMAWALCKPSITIFGPTPINRVYQTSINKVVKSSSKVNHYKLDKNDFSIKEIDEEIIIEMARKLLN